MLVDGVWNDALSFKNIDDSVECFTTVLQGLLGVLLPLHHNRIKQHTYPWVATRRVLAVRWHRDKLYPRGPTRFEIGNLSFHNGLCGDVTDFLVLCAYA